MGQCTFYYTARLLDSGQRAISQARHSMQRACVYHWPSSWPCSCHRRRHVWEIVKSPNCHHAASCRGDVRDIRSWTATAWTGYMVICNGDMTSANDDIAQSTINIGFTRRYAASRLFKSKSAWWRPDECVELTRCQHTPLRLCLSVT